MGNFGSNKAHNSRSGSQDRAMNSTNSHLNQLKTTTSVSLERKIYREDLKKAQSPIYEKEIHQSSANDVEGNSS